MKHAGPEASAVIRAWEEDGTVRFAVSDDGAGFDPAAEGGGSGFVNMADRLGAIGGSLRVESTPGDGTTVLGVLPLAG
jgi:signal transduction histidine kinase